MTDPRNTHKSIRLINVFSVDPKNQEGLIALLTEAAQALVHDTPGFVSSTLHRSLDGTKVTMYAVWKSIDDYNAMRRKSTSSTFLTRALEIAKFDPGIYEVVRTFPRKRKAEK